MTKDEKIVQVKQWRKDLDVVLQQMKNDMTDRPPKEFEIGRYLHSANEQQYFAVHELENCIMRLGQTLKHLGTENPYPNSYDPSNTKVDPTADGLKI